MDERTKTIKIQAGIFLPAHESVFVPLFASGFFFLLLFFLNNESMDYIPSPGDVFGGKEEEGRRKKSAFILFVGRAGVRSASCSGLYSLVHSLRLNGSCETSRQDGNCAGFRRSVRGGCESLCRSSQAENLCAIPVPPLRQSRRSHLLFLRCRRRPAPQTQKRDTGPRGQLLPPPLCLGQPVASKEADLPLGAGRKRQH